MRAAPENLPELPGVEPHIGLVGPVHRRLDDHCRSTVAGSGRAGFGHAVQVFGESNDKLLTHLQRIEAALEKSLARSDEQLEYYVAHCRRHGIAAEYRVAFGTAPVDEFIKLADTTMNEFPTSVCFASKLIFKRVNILTAWLHNHTPVEIQTRLHLQGKQMVLLPMNVG